MTYADFSPCRDELRLAKASGERHSGVVSRKQEERRELWRQKIAQQEESGLAVRAFCREQGVREHSLYRWRQRFRRENTPVRFALVETKSADEAKPQPVELMLASGDHLRIPGDAATLRLALSVLRERQV